MEANQKVNLPLQLKELSHQMLLSLQKKDIAWFYNQLTEAAKKFLGKSFGNIECMLLEYKRHMWIKVSFSVELQTVNMGKYSVCLKFMMMYLTMDKFNSEHHRRVKRGVDHNRPRNDHNERFELVFEIELDGFSGKWIDNFLGQAWMKSQGWNGDNFNWIFPSLAQIFFGIMMEAREHLRETSGCPEGGGELLKAQENMCEIWTQISMLPEIPIDREAPLTRKILRDPSHPVTTLLLRLYSFECFLYGTLNKAQRFGDQSKVQSLGPYAHALDAIMRSAGGRRGDIKEKDLANLDLYRGCCMTEDQIQKYRDAIPKGREIQLFGH